MTETDRRKLFKNRCHRFRKDGEELEALAHLLVVDQEAEATLDLAADLRVGRVVLDQQLLSNFDAQLKKNFSGQVWVKLCHPRTVEAPDLRFYLSTPHHHIIKYKIVLRILAVASAGLLGSMMENGY